MREICCPYGCYTPLYEDRRNRKGHLLCCKCQRELTQDEYDELERLKEEAAQQPAVEEAAAEEEATEVETPAAAKKKDTSAVVGEYLLRGYTLLAEACPSCHTPLVRAPGETLMRCVKCDINYLHPSDFRAQQAKEQKQREEARQEAEREQAARPSAPAPSSAAAAPPAPDAVGSTSTVSGAVMSSRFGARAAEAGRDGMEVLVEEAEGGDRRRVFAAIDEADEALMEKLSQVSAMLRLLTFEREEDVTPERLGAAETMANTLRSLKRALRE